MYLIQCEWLIYKGGKRGSASFIDMVLLCRARDTDPCSSQLRATSDLDNFSSQDTGSSACPVGGEMLVLCPCFFFLRKIEEDQGQTQRRVMEMPLPWLRILPAGVPAASLPQSFPTRMTYILVLTGVGLLRGLLITAGTHTISP